MRGGELGQRRRQPAAGLEVDLGAAVVGQFGEAPARSPGPRGGNPSKLNRSVGSPETASAVVTADGPGRAVTRSPAAAAAETSR